VTAYKEAINKMDSPIIMFVELLIANITPKPYIISTSRKLLDTFATVAKLISVTSDLDIFHLDLNCCCY
jgi:hypothetical protein